jgi:hypothetical protein
MRTSITTSQKEIKDIFQEIRGKLHVKLSLHFSGYRGVILGECPGKQGVFARGWHQPGRLDPKHGLFARSSIRLQTGLHRIGRQP